MYGLGTTWNPAKYFSSCIPSPWPCVFKLVPGRKVRKAEVVMYFQESMVYGFDLVRWAWYFKIYVALMFFCTPKIPREV